MTTTTTNDTSEGLAKSAEICSCPQNYAGPSCETCQPGYKKLKSYTAGQFKCVPCECNGHASSCDPDTGVCLDCENHTHGEHCELCDKTFYRDNNTNGRFECRSCPCPLPSVFADSCKIQPYGNKLISCDCYEGYAGIDCGQCQAGYFGNPKMPGGKCQPCKCNNNIGNLFVCILGDSCFATYKMLFSTQKKIKKIFCSLTHKKKF
jgi:hypothetical protein